MRRLIGWWFSGATGALALMGILSGPALAQKGEVVIVTYGGTALEEGNVRVPGIMSPPPTPLTRPICQHPRHTPVG